MSLGSIIVRLTMNTADFETDAGRAAKIAQRRAKEIDDAFRKAGKAIGIALGTAIVAAATGAAFALKGAVDSMDETYNAAKKVGESTENFSRLQYAAGLADVGMDQLVTTMGRLTKAQAAALKDGSQQAKVFDALGIAATNADGSLRATTDVMLDFADRFAEMKGSPEAMAAGFELFGRSFQDLIPLLEQGSGEIRRLMAEADALGITLSESAGAAADQFKDQLDKLNLAVGGIWKEIAAGLLPALDDSAARLTTLASDGDLARNATTLLSTALSFGVGALEAYNNAVARTSIAIEYFVGAASGALEMQKNLMTFGFADGSVMGGIEKQTAAYKNAQSQLDRLIADQGLRKAGMTRDQYNNQMAGKFNIGIPGTGGSMFPALPFNFAQDQASRAPASSPNYSGRVAAALGGGAATVRKSGGGGKSEATRQAEDAARAATEAADAQERWHGTILDMEATLAGPMAEANREYERNVAQLNEDFNEGHIALSDYARGLEAYAAQRDKDIEAINARKGPAEEMLADLALEHELLGKTRDEQEMLTAERYLGAEAATAQGKAALAALKLEQEARNAMADQIETMDGLRDSANGFLDDLQAGEGVWNSLAKAASNFAGVLADIAQRKLIEAIFGQTGSAQGGAGGGLMSLFTNFVGSLFGGVGGASAGGGGYVGGPTAGPQFASGGYTGAGGTFEVAGTVHKGEVVWSKGDVARAGGVAQVESMRRGSASAPGEAKRPLVVFSEAQMLDALAAHGGLEKVVVHYMERNRDRMRASVYD